MLLFIISCCSFLSSLIHGSPLVLRDVWNPHIISPNQNTVWVVGTTVTVTWQTSDAPSSLTNPNGTLLLGQMGPNGENLQIDNPLAQHFKLMDGKVQITVPNTVPGNNYIVVLLGDSGNASPTFSIVASGSSSISRTSMSVLNSTPIPSNGTTTTGTGTVTITSPISTSTPLSRIESSTSTSSSSSRSSTTSSSTASPSTTPSPATGSSRTSSAWASFHMDSTKALIIGMLSLFSVFLA
ncbi:hypothetical protein L208DRAFT_1394341 [Tricholoma matsutake]|nr:hypothetical protein L208DRAFT_1394341 [Tricholoma matsutake 945]